MSQIITPQTELQHKIIQHITAIGQLIPSMKITFIARTPDRENANIFMTQEKDFDDILREVHRVIAEQKKKKTNTDAIGVIQGAA